MCCSTSKRETTAHQQIPGCMPHGPSRFEHYQQVPPKQPNQRQQPEIGAGTCHQIDCQQVLAQQVKLVCLESCQLYVICFTGISAPGTLRYEIGVRAKTGPSNDLRSLADQCKRKAMSEGMQHMAVGQNQWYHFGVGAPPILVYFSGDWDVHWGTIWILTRAHMFVTDSGYRPSWRCPITAAQAGPCSTRLRFASGPWVKRP